MNPPIKDRFDLTLECIRRHSPCEDSPLASPRARYAKFFDLFVDLSKHVDFFHLQDLVDADGQVSFLLPFDGFVRSPAPTTVAEYLRYMDQSMDFVARRTSSNLSQWTAPDAELSESV